MVGFELAVAVGKSTEEQFLESLYSVPTPVERDARATSLHSFRFDAKSARSFFKPFAVRFAFVGSAAEIRDEEDLRVENFPLLSRIPNFPGAL
jgi:hypothetical protein